MQQLKIKALIEIAEIGISALAVGTEYKRAAIENLEIWLSEQRYQAYREQLQWLIEQQAWSVLLDSFYRIIPFGTGGRRGAVGIGPNRINPETMSSSVQGHVDYLRQKYGDQACSTVIAYDVRLFLDLRGIYNPALPNPLRGMRSMDFAHLAASAYAANGITSYLLCPDDEESYISTPELSFLIRNYGTQAGLNISASHNHPDDNGGKFYNEQGGQPVPPDDQDMLDMVSQVSEVKMMPFDQAITEGWVKWIEPQRREQYIALNLSLGRRDVRPQPVRIAYTPMNGTGTTNVGKVLIEAGHTVEIFPAQSQYDGSFGGVRYRTPNPEVRQAMEDVITWAEERGADLALATDPDADRIGLAAPDANGRWRFFAGNEIASLLTYYRLQSLSERGQLPHKPLVVKTEVTTNLMHKIAESFGAVCLGELLVGFKYIAAALHQWDIGETYLGISGKSADFIIGCEESHGVLLSADVRDKDAAGAALLLAELASELKAKKQNFVDYLQQIYRKYGYHANQLSSMVMEGAVGLESIRRMQAVLREDPPKTIGNIKVLHFIDHWDENGRFGRVQSETDRSSRNVLVFELDNDARVILRPSGTEPKTKLYVEVHSTPADDQEPFDDVIAKADVQAQMLLDVFTKEVLMRIGIDVPMFALRCSDLLSIDNKLRFAKILSAWLEQLTNRDPQTLTQDPDADRTWLLPQLQAINPNPRGLLDAGFKLFLSDLKQQAQIPSHILDQMSKIWQDLP